MTNKRGVTLLVLGCIVTSCCLLNLIGAVERAAASTQIVVPTGGWYQVTHYLVKFPAKPFKMHACTSCLCVHVVVSCQPLQRLAVQLPSALQALACTTAGGTYLPLQSSSALAAAASLSSGHMSCSSDTCRHGHSCGQLDVCGRWHNVDGVLLMLYVCAYLALVLALFVLVKQLPLQLHLHINSKASGLSHMP